MADFVHSLAFSIEWLFFLCKQNETLVDLLVGLVSSVVDAGVDAAVGEAFVGTMVVGAMGPMWLANGAVQLFWLHLQGQVPTCVPHPRCCLQHFAASIFALVFSLCCDNKASVFAAIA